MVKIISFTSNVFFETEFRKCSKEYNQLEMYVAWIGNPDSVIPFKYLQSITSIEAVVGISFCQTHPDGIQFLMDLKTDLRIANEEVLYHPKVYIFTNDKKKAIFIGSSNFTFHGFHKNHEVNVLIEGSASDRVIADLEIEMKKYSTKDFSFVPDKEWLNSYGERYKKRRQKMKDAGLDDEVETEERTSNSAAWLAIADWSIYMKKFQEGLKDHKEKFGNQLSDMFLLFKQYKEALAVPWSVEYFQEKKNGK